MKEIKKVYKKIMAQVKENQEAKKRKEQKRLEKRQQRIDRVKPYLKPVSPFKGKTFDPFERGPVSGYMGPKQVFEMPTHQSDREKQRRMKKHGILYR